MFKDFGEGKVAGDGTVVCKGREVNVCYQEEGERGDDGKLEGTISE